MSPLNPRLDQNLDRVRKRQGRPPAGLLGMLALIVVVESFVWRHPVAFSDYASLAWQDSAVSAQGAEVRRAEVLCLGDSLVKVGVLPRILDARLGCSTFNLGLYGGQASSSYFLLRRALDAGARPRAIVIDFHPNLLAVAPKASKDHWPGLLNVRDGLDLAATTADPELIAGAVATWLVPSVRDRHGLRTSILAALDGQTSESAFDLRALQRNWRHNQGAHLVAPRLYEPKPDADGPPAGPGIVWSVNRSNATYVRRLLQLAADRQIAVVWVIPPADPSWQAHRERIGADAGLTRFARSMAAAFPGVLIVDGRHSGYGPSAFVDETHMGTVGATDFSLSVADALAPRLTGRTVPGGIVPLAPFQGRAGGVALEDLQQTKAILAEADRARRF